jgi:hypothetical protein
MRLALSLFTILILQGCSSIGVTFNQTSSSGDYNPLTLPTVDPDKYKSDKQLCFKQVETQVSKDMAVNLNIMKFRKLLDVNYLDRSASIILAGGSGE